MERGWALLYHVRRHLYEAGQGLTLPTRNLTAETDTHVHIEDELTLATVARPKGIDQYYAEIEKLLDSEQDQHRILKLSQSLIAPTVTSDCLVCLIDLHHVICNSEVS